MLWSQHPVDWRKNSRREQHKRNKVNALMSKTSLPCRFTNLNRKKSTSKIRKSNRCSQLLDVCKTQALESIPECKNQPNCWMTLILEWIKTSKQLNARKKSWRPSWRTARISACFHALESKSSSLSSLFSSYENQSIDSVIQCNISFIFKFVLYAVSIYFRVLPPACCRLKYS